jgi:hypothetical protein
MPTLSSGVSMRPGSGPVDHDAQHHPDRFAAQLDVENLESVAPRHPLGGLAQPRNLLGSWQFLAPETQKGGHTAHCRNPPATSIH